MLSKRQIVCKLHSLQTDSRDYEMSFRFYLDSLLENGFWKREIGDGYKPFRVP